MTVNRTEERIELTAIDRGATAAIGNVTNSLGGLRTGLDTVKSAMAAVGVTLGVGAMAAYAAEIIKTTGAIKGMSEATGASVEGLLKIENVARINGHEFQGVTNAIGMMIRNLNAGGEQSERTARALDLLGIKAKDSNGQIRDGAQIMIEMAKALDGYEDSGNKVALVQEVLGRSGQQYMQLLKDLAKESDLVSTKTAEQVEKADQLEKNTRRLIAAMQDVHAEFVLANAGWMVDFTQRLIDANREGQLFAQTLNEIGRASGFMLQQSWSPLERFIGRGVEYGLATAPGAIQRVQGTIKPAAWYGMEPDLPPSVRVVPPLPGKTDATNSGASAATVKAHAEALKRATEEMKLYVQAAQQVVDADMAQGAVLAQANQALSERVQQIEFETSLIGMGDADRDKLIAFRQVDLELQRQMVDLAPEQISALYELAEAEKARLGAAIDGRAARQGAVKIAEEAKRAHEEAARAAEQEWNDLWSNVESTGRTVFASLFADGANAMEGIGKAIKASIIDMLYQLTVRKWIINIGASISGVGAAGAAQAGGFGGMGGFSPSSLLDLGGGLEFMSGAASTFGGSAATTAALIESGTVGMAGAGMEFAAGVGASTGAMSMLGPIGIGFGLLSATGLLDGIFGGGGGPKASEIWLQGGPGGFGVGIDNAAGGNPDMGAVHAINALLSDSSKYDQAQLAGMVGRRYSTGSPADTGALIGLLTQALAPAQKAAEDAARAQEEAAQAMEQLVAQEERTASALTSAVRGLSSRLGIDTLQGAVNDMAVSDTRAPTQRLAAARGIFEATYSRALEGDLGAVQSLPDSVQSLLGIGRETFASGPQFQSLFVEANRALNDVLGRQQAVQDSLLRDVGISIVQSGADNVAALRAGFETLKEELVQVRAELRRRAA